MASGEVICQPFSFTVLVQFPVENALHGIRCLAGFQERFDLLGVLNLTGRGDIVSISVIYPPAGRAGGDNSQPQQISDGKPRAWGLIIVLKYVEIEPTFNSAAQSVRFKGFMDRDDQANQEGKAKPARSGLPDR